MSLEQEEVTGENASAALGFLDEYMAGAPRGDFLASPARVEWRRGQALVALGRVDEARTALRASVDLDPSLKEPRNALSDLDD